MTSGPTGLYFACFPYVPQGGCSLGGPWQLQADGLQGLQNRIFPSAEPAVALTGSRSPVPSKAALVPRACCPCAVLDPHSCTEQLGAEAGVVVLWPARGRRGTVAQGRRRGRQSAAWHRGAGFGVVAPLGFGGRWETQSCSSAYSFYLFEREWCR